MTITIRQVDREANRIDHDQVLNQSCPWIEEPEKRYTEKHQLPPAEPQGGGNREDWAHIRRHVAINLDQFTEEMRTALSRRTKKILEPEPVRRGLGPPAGSVQVGFYYRLREQVKSKPASVYYDGQGEKQFYGRQKIVNAHTQHYRGHLRTVEGYRYIAYYSMTGRQIKNPFRPPSERGSGGRSR